MSVEEANAKEREKMLRARLADLARLTEGQGWALADLVDCIERDVIELLKVSDQLVHAQKRERELLGLDELKTARIRQLEDQLTLTACYDRVEAHIRERFPAISKFGTMEVLRLAKMEISE